ncbi:hypothetical protein [Chitinophaga alhagiae]|uniref:hypothetical protein n=1 Tax=Chitinophaga alhagiae TaxID=2203219 RepID=UPI0013004684|nr:hypothetical protein [Chitinophaga alhagiae]
MKPPLLSPKLIIFTVLFIVWVLLFEWIKPYGYFHAGDTVTHIIDSHLQPDSSIHSLAEYGGRFFDHGYVQAAAPRYDPGKYLRSFYIVDFFFPFIYLNFFLALAGYWKGTAFYRVYRAAMIFCALFDLLENTSFAYYLFHQDGGMHQLVAIFTTLKSVLFGFGFVLAVGAFGAACIHWSRNGRRSAVKS